MSEQKKRIRLTLDFIVDVDHDPLRLIEWIVALLKKNHQPVNCYKYNILHVYEKDG